MQFGFLPKRINPDIPQELSDFVMKAIDARPDKRFQSAEEMLEALMEIEIRENEPEVAPEPQVAEKDDGSFMPLFMIVFTAILIPTLLFLGDLLPAKLPVEEDKPKVVPAVNQKIKVSIHTQPIDALVAVDGKVVDPADLPLVLLEPGNHIFDIEADGYFPQTNYMTLSADSFQILNFQLQREEDLFPEPKPETKPEPVAVMQQGVSLTSTPSGAAVWFNGKKMNGLTPIKLQDVDPGTYEVVFRKSGYQDVTRTISVRESRPASLRATMAAFQGTLTIDINPGGKIYIDSRFHSESAGGEFRVNLPVGIYNVAVVHHSGSRWEKSVNIGKDGNYMFAVDFSETIPVMVISPGVEWAEIRVDGKSNGYTPKKLNLPVGYHEIEVSRDGYTSTNNKFGIHLENGMGPQKVTFQLQKTSE